LVQNKLVATLGLRIAVSVRNPLETHLAFAALKEIGEVASARGSADGLKMELPWIIDQMLENTWPQHRSSIY
jgi:hypothetical protein